MESRWALSIKQMVVPQKLDPKDVVNLPLLWLKAPFSIFDIFHLFSWVNMLLW
jgi:hypothetical protein